MDFYRKTVIETTVKYKHIMSLLKNTSRNNLESARLVELQKEYAGFISADYMMTRTLPYWGSTPQPAKTYYQIKLVVDIFGIVDYSSSEKNFAYLCDEIAAGAKSTNHTISFLEHYVNNTLMIGFVT